MNLYISKEEFLLNIIIILELFYLKKSNDKHGQSLGWLVRLSVEYSLTILIGSAEDSVPSNFYVGGYVSPSLTNYEFRIVFILDWLISKTRELSLPCSLPHKWWEKRDGYICLFPTTFLWKWPWLELEFGSQFPSFCDNCHTTWISID